MVGLFYQTSRIIVFKIGRNILGISNFADTYVWDIFISSDK